MAASLGKAYVQIVPQAPGIQNEVQGILDPAASKAGKSAGNTIGNAFKSGASKAVSAFGTAFVNVAATGSAAIAGMSSAVTQSALKGGLSRAIGLDNATAKFKQLGMDVDGMMASVSESVSGTRYSLDQAASVAVNFGSAGIKAGTDMTNALKSVASVASISGKEFGDIGTIYTKVASQGKLTGETLNQLSENGINANAALGKALGKSTEEIRAMVSAGQIDFKTFSDAMTAYFGDAAMSANTTFQGALANTQSALSRMGAMFETPALGALRTIFAGTSEESVGLIGAINAVNTSLQPLADKFTEIADVVGVKVANALNTFATTLTTTGSIIEAVKSLFVDLIPDSLMQKFNELSPSMQSFVSKLASIGGVLAGIATGWGVFTGAITMLAPGLARLLGPLASVGGMFTIIRTAGTNLLGVFMQMIPGLGTTGSSLGTLAGRLGGLAGPIGWAITAFGLMFANSEQFRFAIGGLIQSIGSALMPVITTIMGVVAQLMPVISSLAGTLGDALAPILRALSPIIAQIGARLNGAIRIVSAIAIPVIKAAVKVIQTVAPAVSKVVTEVVKLVGKFSSAFGKIRDAITKPIDKAKAVVKGFVDTVKKIFPLKIGKIFSDLKLPKISVTGGKAPYGLLGKGKAPKFDVKWNARAENQPYMFTDATLFGAGERNDEILYGRAALMRDIREASQGGQGVVQNITINVDGAEDPEEFATRLAARLKMEMRTA